MKILSKYKDYYDYLSGIYGEDPKLVLDRRSGGGFQDLTEDTKYYIFIGGFQVEGYYRDGKMYYGENLREIEVESGYRGYREESVFVVSDSSTKHSVWVSTIIKKDEKDHNLKSMCPIILCRSTSYRDEPQEIMNYPKLEDLQLGSFIDPMKVYQMISEWLAKRIDELELTTTTTNEQKIENKGFDRKTSFRPNMK
jgi:hypothetical protein